MQVNFEINKLKADIFGIQEKIELYQRRVEETPRREQELMTLTRDYNNQKEIYNSMLNRKLEAEIAVSMEKKQKGEQFRVIDPAKMPTNPVAPDLKKILLMTLMIGLCLGCGLAYLTETMDDSYKTPEELEKALQLPVLISVPIRYTEREQKWMKRKQWLMAGSVTICFFVSAITIVITTKGFDATLNYIKTILVRV